MRLRSTSFAMTGLLGAMTALGSISNDTYLPSLPAISAELHASPERVQLTLSAFLIGFAIGQIFYGPISDKVGRKPTLLAGFVLFLVATAICMTARSIDILIFGRILQSFGASGPIILARAIVRDLYEGPRAARELSIMATIMGVSPVLAPVLGGVLQARFGWRASFIAVECLGLAIGAPSLLFLPETLARRQTAPIGLGTVMTSYGVVWKKHGFRAYAAILTASYSGLFAYVSASSFVLQNIYGLSAIAFSVAFAICSVSFIVGSFASSRFSTRLGSDGTIRIGVLALAIGGCTQFVLSLLHPRDVFSLLGSEMIFMTGVGLSMPHLMTAAMAPFPERAGAASSLLGVIQMTGAALVGAALGAALGPSPLPFATTTAAAGLASCALYFSTGAIRAGSRPEAEAQAIASTAATSLARSSSRDRR